MRFQTKMIVSFTLLIIVFGLSISYFIYATSVKLLTDTIALQARQIAESSAKTIDKELYQTTLKRTLAMQNPIKEKSEIMESVPYLMLRKMLANIRDANGLKFIYTMAHTPSNSTIYLLDGIPIDDSVNHLPGDRVESIDLSIASTFSERRVVMGKFTVSDEYGPYLAAYAPMFKSDGTFLGVLATGFDAKKIDQLMSQLKFEMGLFIAVGALLTIILSFLWTKYLVSPLNQLTEQAQFIREGDLSVRSNIKSKDEIGQLGAAFDEMVYELYDQRNKMEQLVRGISIAQKRSDLTKLIVSEVQKIAPFKSVELIEFDGKQVLSGESSLRPIIREHLKDLAPQMIVGDMVQLGDGYLFLMGSIQENRYILWVEGRDLQRNQRDRMTLQLFAQHASIYFENMFLVEELTRKINNFQNENEIPLWMSKLILQMSETERKRLASDLHDEVIQEVNKYKRTLSQVLSQQDAVSDTARITLQQVEFGLINISDMIRETCNELLPSFLMEKGIVPSVGRLVQKIRLRANFNLHFDTFAVEQEMDFEEMLTVYRLVQEMMNNAMKHSRATDVDLMLRQDQGKMIIYYSDNGVGMNLDVGVDRTKHLGFHGLQERIKLMNGTVSIRSAMGEGLEMSFQFPLRSAGGVGRKLV